MRYNAAIFDMDGTLLDTLADLHAAVNASMRWAGAPERSIDEVRRFVGNGAYKLIERSLPAGTPRARIEQVLAFYRPYYEMYAQHLTAPYPGIPEALRRLRSGGVRLAIASNKPDGAVKQLAERYFPGLFDAALGDRTGLRVKPAADLLLVSMNLLHTEPGTTVYIGDSDVDIETARNAGVDCISVSWGFREEAFLLQNGAQTLVHSAGELTSAILGDTPPLP